MAVVEHPKVRGLLDIRRGRRRPVANAEVPMAFEPATYNRIERILPPARIVEEVLKSNAAHVRIVAKPAPRNGGWGSGRHETG